MYEFLVMTLGEPQTAAQENYLYFFGGFVVVFIISCLFDLIINMTKR